MKTFDFIVSLLQNFLTKSVDNFKQKNAIAFIVIELALGTLLYGVWELQAAVTPEGVEVLGEAGKNIVMWVDKVIIALMSILGAHTPGSQVPPTKDN